MPEAEQPSSAPPVGDVPFTVDLYVYATHEVVLWEPLWRALRRRGVDVAYVVEPPGVNRARGTTPDQTNGWRDDKSGALSPLMDDHTFVTTLEMLDGLGVPWIHESREDADAVVTTQGTGWLLHYGDAGARIRTMYGVGATLDSWGHGPINVGFDLVLAHGPFSALAIADHLPVERIATVGFPKWAPALREGLDRAAARRSLDIPDDGRPVVAWLPTWAHHSSLDVYGPALAALATDHWVVAKPHHNNLHFEQARLDEVPEGVTIRADVRSAVPLLVAADVVVSDARSGATTEAILADRPTVALVNAGSLAANGVLGRLDEAVVPCGSPLGLADAVARALHGPDQRAGRSRWARWFFADHRGDDDHVAADRIVDLIRDRRAQAAGLPTAPVLGLAELEGLLDRVDIEPGLAGVVLELGWRRWPGEPRLLDLIGRTGRTLSTAALLEWSRRVRLADRVDACPLVRLLVDDDVDPVRRLAAAVAAGSHFDDPIAAAAFPDLVAGLSGDRFVEALIAVDQADPSVLPLLVAGAASTPARCDQLADALRHVGALEQAAAVAAHGQLLATDHAA